MFGIKPNDIGEFTVKKGSIMFLVKKGTVLDAHRIKTDKNIDFARQREQMEKDIAANIVKEMK